MRVSFIGLGSMGLPMAQNLLKAGHELVVYNRTRSRSDELGRNGARVAGSPREPGPGPGLVNPMLAAAPPVEKVMFGSEGALASLKPGAVHVSMSTISHLLS